MLKRRHGTEDVQRTAQPARRAESAGQRVGLARASYLAGGRPYRVSAVLFDFDGTLTRPGALDFAAIRHAVRCPPEKDLLEHIRGIRDFQERARCEQVLEQAEAEAAKQAEPNAGAADLVGFLRARGVPMAIITRNVRVFVERALERLEGINIEDFAVVVSRDLPFSPKPAPDGVRYVARELGVPVEEVLVVGDHPLDVAAGKQAGALTVFLRNDTNGGSGEESLGSAEENLDTIQADFVAGDLGDVREIVRHGLPLPVGKLPADFLGESLRDIVSLDPAVLVGAAIGEDAAAFDVGAEEVLVIASDPITLATDSLA
ncbi:MAG: HAD-IA family hydrolase, partial [Thermoleophilia bacterium]|nr:HAD-IA family hydrolase [Thermoleophilia bacterium]